MRRTRLPALALALALGACDAGPDEPRQAERTIGPGPDPTLEDTAASASRTASTAGGCALLTTQQVEQALGFEVVMNGNMTGNCVVTPADGASSAPAVDFKIENRVSAYDYFAAQPDAEPVPGLGDRAVWATINEMTGNLVTVADGRAIVVAVARADGLDARSRNQAEALTRAILAAGLN